MTSSENRQLNYIRGIDGLRALAVLAVMLFHLDRALLPGGFSGVDIFFVISGYVVSASLLRHAGSDFVQFTGSFYARRILRIFPALIVCLLVSSLAATLFIPASWLSGTSNKTGLAAFFGLANIALIVFNDGYFSPRTDFNPFTHTWSLAVEEQFYLIYPAVFFVWMRYKSRNDVTGVVARHLLSVLLLLSFSYSAFSTSTAPDTAFYLLPSRFWELGAGALLLHQHSNGMLIPRSNASAMLHMLFGTLLIAVGFILSEKKDFPFPWAMLPAVGTVLLISSLMKRNSGSVFFERLLESSVVVYIGKISYSLYLWHWPVYVLFRWTTGLKTVAECSLALALSAAFAAISYHFIEQPFRTVPIRRARPVWQIIGAGIVSITAAFFFSRLIFDAQPLISLSVTKDKKNWYPHPWPKKKNDAVKIFAGRKIFTIGDSHAGAYLTMLQKISENYGVDIINMSEGGCSVANLINLKITRGKRCAELFDKYLVKIKSSSSPGDIVFFASLRMRRLGDQWGTFSREKIIAEQKSIDARNGYEAAFKETAEIVKIFHAMRLHVIIDAPKPIFPSPPFRCSDWFNKSNPVCSAGFTVEQNFLLEHRRPVMESLKRLSAQFPYLIVWDPFPVLCDSKLCSAFDSNGIPLFFDGDHLSAHGNRVLYPSFELMIKKVWQKNI